MIRSLLIGITLLSATHLLADTKGLIEGKINKKVIATSQNKVEYPSDLDFNKADLNQLWILNKGVEGGENGGTTLMITNPGTAAQSFDYRKDGNAWHFMVNPGALAFGDTTWATAQDYFNANRQETRGAWCGPTMWPSDLDIYAIVGNPPNGQQNGSHYDMVHQSTYSSGIAHEFDNTYWVNDGNFGNITKYKFNEAHVPGGHEHENAEVYRHVDVPYSMNPNAPAHMEIRGNWLYYVNPGAKTINRMDITSGTIGKDLSATANYGEELAAFVEVNNTIWETVVSTGLESPSGLDVNDEYLIVSDNATGEIIIYDIDTFEELKRLQTDALSIMGIKFDTEGDIYYVDHIGQTVNKLEGMSGVNIYTSQNHLNYTLTENTVNVIVENNTDSEITISVASINDKLIASSAELGFNYNVTTPETIVPITVPAGEVGSLQLIVDITSGNGIAEVESSIMIANGENEDSFITTLFTFSSNGIPLVYVYDDIDQNKANADLGGLLSTNDYKDYVEIDAMTYINYGTRVSGIKTLIWNMGSFGILNSHEHMNFQTLRDGGTSLLLLGDGPYYKAGFEAQFTLAPFGARYNGTYFQGYETGGEFTLNGVEGDAISDGYSNISGLITIYNNGANAWPTIEVSGINAESHNVFYHAISIDSTVAIRNDNGSTRTVTLGMNMYNFTDGTQRNNIFKGIMDWLTYKDVTGIFELAGYEPVSVYPNPTTDYVQFDNLKITANTSIKLLDIAGNTIRNIDYTQTNINVSNLVSGTYFLMVESDNEIKFAKFVKQ